MENESRCWQEHIWERRANQKILPRTTQLPERVGTDDILDYAIGKHTLAFAIQRRSTTWTALPSHFKKPYATTTWCHAIELAAALGIYWKDFDRSQDIYRAQGNGYVIKSSIAPDLGTVLTFQVHGRSRFEQFRLIPKDEIKELCFGLVPTIFRSGDTRRLYLQSNNTTPTTEILHLANLDEIAQSLAVIGCNTWATRLVSENKIGSHIFPVIFEIIGMVAKSLHIKYSVFRMLPNPTPYKWETNASSLTLMMQSFLHHCNESAMHNTAARNQTFVQREIQRRAQAILECGSQSENGNTDVDLIDLLHTYNMRERAVMMKNYTTNSNLMRSPSDTEKPGESTRSKEQKAEEILRRKRKALTLLTLRIHIQVTLAGLQEGTTPSTRLDIESVEGSADFVTWNELERVPPELRQAKLIELYFRIVRPKVISEVEKLASNLDISASVSDTDPEESKPGQADTTENDSEKLPLWQVKNVSCEDIWYTLVFRSICWLMLHNFHPDDIQISKSDLFGSRLPVYIA
ncbi:hypothetical protein CGCS363_v007131 [Colletotrichum siamense]|uniref:uncharacterized protein n=1 Tax=Colletotrichum siamense TaxID=690259 RepID=UPI0018725927|nr:uncharacterized protein CGCS363_v007131 [Colletotrichum siamense]KAF5500183.1 hypothetical protein CGCS363_v007131 [Colletotrichum siamense]